MMLPSSVSGNMARIVVNGESYDVRIGKSPDGSMVASQPAITPPGAGSIGSAGPCAGSRPGDLTS